MMRTEFVLLALFALPMTVTAQNFSGDARRIGMGGVGERSNMASEMAGDARDYRSIVLPLGLYQVLEDTNVFDPRSDSFNPVRAMELAANPIHFTLDRDTNDAGSRLVEDVVNGTVSRDLNQYRGFAPAQSLTAAGLLAPSFGKTFRIAGNQNESFHGIYAGAGPYVSVGTGLAIDPALIDLLGSGTDTYLPNTTFVIADQTDAQAAAAGVIGYRARFGVPGRGFGASDRDGIYVAANYNYLYGFHYDAFDMAVRFDTDSEGLITLAPATEPVSVERLTSSRGRGFAVDVATAIVVDRWEFAFAAQGIANRIDWSNFSAERFALSSLLDGGGFESTPLPAPTGPSRVELPVRYSGGGVYHADAWSVEMEVSDGLQDLEFHGGGEYRTGFLELRGGGRYTRDLWHASAGIGLNLPEGFGLDLAAFGTATNIERRRTMSFAVSLRFDR